MSRRAALLPLLLLLAGCQQQMADQPSYRPLEPTTFFPDGRSARPPVDGAVSRTQPLSNDPLGSGLKPDAAKTRPVAKAGEEWMTPTTGAPYRTAEFLDELPFTVTKDDLVRGQARYQIFCVPCHGPLGNGNGKIPERGFLRPPSYHTVAADPTEPETGVGDLARGYSRGFHRFGQKIALDEVPLGYVYEVIAKGYGGMPEHATQIKPDDRWRIVAYVRALQLSQKATLSKLPAGIQEKAKQAAEAKP